MQFLTAKQYLQIDIANSYGHGGLDKQIWDVRLDWFKQNQHCLHSLVKQAKEPALFLAGVLAWEDVVAGRPVHYPISLDATASGMQLLAALTGDSKAGALCNLVGSDSRMDAYTALYEVIRKHFPENGRIERDDVKAAIMTSLYTSEAVPREVFGEGPMLERFYEVMATELPVAWELNCLMLELWDPNASSHNWVLPDNFHVVTPVTQTQRSKVTFLGKRYEVAKKVIGPTPTGRSLGANMVHSVDGLVNRELVARCYHDPAQIRRILHWIESGAKGTKSDNVEIVQKLWHHYSMSGFLSARILEHLDPVTLQLVDVNPILDLIASLPSKPFKVISVHD